MITVDQLVRKHAPGSASRDVALTPEIDALLDADAPVAIGVSGGKDSQVAAVRTVTHLRRRGHKGPVVLVHSDLGRVEWKESLPVCERLAQRLGVELLVVRREAGDMIARWYGRWANNLVRYRELSCVKLILPWSTPSMRFCTSELKTAIICRALTKRFAGSTIVSVSGIRRAESSARSRAPIAAPQAKLTSRKHRTTGVDWHPVIEWSHGDVFAYVAEQGIELHEAYLRFGMSRVSCSFCIMSNENDLIASAGCDDNVEAYRLMVDLEIASTFAFQGARWLGDVAPDRLTADQRKALEHAKVRGAVRSTLEASIPDHLLFEKGWPRVMPTRDEAVSLASVRRMVASELGITGMTCTDTDSLLARYADLMAENARRIA